MTDSDFVSEILAILKEGKPKYALCLISTEILKNKLSARGISFDDHEIVSAINRLIIKKSVRLIRLLCGNSGLEVEICYPADLQS